MSDLIYRVCKDVFYAGGKLSTAEYDELCGMLETE